MKISNNLQNIAFTSDEHREAQIRAIQYQREQERQREIQRERERQLELEHQRQIELERKRIEELNNNINSLNNNITSSLNYRGLSEPLCDNMAAFMLNFSCSMLMDSEHDLREFFGTEEEAKELQKELSPECRKTSQEIRSELMSLKMSEDPVFGLITVNRLKDYMPEEGILTDEQYNVIADTTKFACTNLIKQGDYEKFDDEERVTVKELIDIVENTPGLNFGEEFDNKLSSLINKINNKNVIIINESSYTKTFIPPVEVRYNEREREQEEQIRI